MKQNAWLTCLWGGRWPEVTDGALGRDGQPASGRLLTGESRNRGRGEMPNRARQRGGFEILGGVGFTDLMSVSSFFLFFLFITYIHILVELINRISQSLGANFWEWTLLSF